jgi:hypothetical protein
VQFHWIRWPELSQLPRAVMFFFFGDSYRNIQKISKTQKSTSKIKGRQYFTIHGLITGKSSPEMWSNTTNSRGFPTDFPSKMSWLSIYWPQGSHGECGSSWTDRGESQWKPQLVFQGASVMFLSIS